MLPDELAGEDYCYLTTTGRKSGSPHTIEIWFALSGLNLGGSSFQGWGYVVEDAGEDDLARQLLFDKYQPRYSGDLTSWRHTALPVAVGLGGPPAESRAGNP